MKILTTKQISKIRHYPPDKVWREGLLENTVREIMEMNKKPWAYWKEGKSYIWKGKEFYWCVTKGYINELGYKI